MLTKDAIVEYYPNGQLEWSMPIEWHEIAKYRRHGEAVQYYMNTDGSLGPVKLRRAYEHGIEVGEEILYYRDGTICSRITFKDGKRDGLYEFNHPDGSKETCRYDAGELVPGSIEHTDKHGQKKGIKDNAKSRSESDLEPKKILPGDYVPAAILRKSVQR